MCNKISCFLLKISPYPLYFLDDGVNLIKTKLDRYGLTSTSKSFSKAIKSDEEKEKYKCQPKTFSQRAKDTYHQKEIFNELLEESFLSQAKYQNIIKIRENYSCERYLKIRNISHRSALSKLRIACHNLLSETSKWYNQNDICPNCRLNETENEVHIILNCRKYKALRDETFEFIRQLENFEMSKVKKLKDIIFSVAFYIC